MAIELQTNLALEPTPVAPEHVVNIRWVQEFFTGRVKMPCRLVSTVNIASTYHPHPDQELEMAANGHLEVDGEPVNMGDRVLIVGQSNQTQNGIYDVTDVGSTTAHARLVRSSDFNQSNQIFSGVSVAVNEGDFHSNTTWRLVTPDPITLDISHLEFISTAPAIGASKFAAEIHGDGFLRDFRVDHNLGSDEITVQVWNVGTRQMVLTDVTYEDDNAITIGFTDPPPSTGHYRIVVIG